MTLAIVPGDLDDARVRALLALHVSSSRATGGCDHSLEAEELKAPGIRLWAAWDEDRLLGVGALQRLSDDHGEIKSMHTRDDCRRCGVGSALLLHIIDAARAAGMRRVSLETGSADYFVAARALYQKHGFIVCEPFGDYALDPSSVYMTRTL